MNKKTGFAGFNFAVGAGLEPARVSLPATFQEWCLTNSAQPTKKCGGGGTRTHKPLFKRLQFSKLLAYQFAALLLLSLSYYLKFFKSN